MWKKAQEMGCNYIATGHYAKTEYSEKYGRWVLKKSNAGRKDQSYVLWNIPKELIEHILFPLSDFETKDEIRKIAFEKDLPQNVRLRDVVRKIDGKYIKLQIWDTCGQEIYRSLISSFYRNSSLAMMVYAIDK